MLLKEKIEDFIVYIIKVLFICPYYKYEDRLVLFLFFFYKIYDKTNEILANFIFFVYKSYNLRAKKNHIKKTKKEEFLNSVKIEND